MNQRRFPFTSSYGTASGFTIFTGDGEAPGTIGFDVDDPLGRGRGWFTPDQARAVAAELTTWANVIDPATRPVEPTDAELKAAAQRLQDAFDDLRALTMAALVAERERSGSGDLDETQA